MEIERILAVPSSTFVDGVAGHEILLRSILTFCAAIDASLTVATFPYILAKIPDGPPPDGSV